MKHIKKQIYDILIEHQQDEQSSTGITGEKIIYGDYYEFIVEDVINLIQIIFDPENQPNQLGIENPFKQQSYSKEEVLDIITKWEQQSSWKEFPEEWLERFKKK